MTYIALVSNVTVFTSVYYIALTEYPFKKSFN